MNILSPAKINTVLLLILLNLVGSALQAQPDTTLNTATPTEQSGQWKDVINSTVKRHAEYLLYDSQKQIGQGYQKQAKGLFGGDPSVSLLHYNDAISSNNGYREWEAGLELPLWLPGERSTRRRVSEGYFSAAEADLGLLTWKVAGEVQELAWDIYLAEATEKQAYKQWQSTLSLEENINRRVQAGELPRSDKLMSQQSTLEREAAYQAAISQRQQAKNAWQNFTGLTTVPVQNNTPASLSVQSGEQKPLSEHPLLQSFSAMMDRTRAQRDNARIKRRDNPVLTLLGKSERASRNDSFDSSIGAQISVPFGLRSYAAPKLAEAEAALTAVQVKKLAAERQLRLQQKQAQQAIDKTSIQLELANQSNNVAQQRLHLAQRGFELGETEFYLLLLAREKAARIALELEKIKIEHQRAINRYNHSHGVIPE